MRAHTIWAALHKVWGAGSGTDRLLRALQQSVEANLLWELDARELSRRFPQVPEERWEQFASRRQEIDLSQAEAYFLQNQIQIILYSDPSYPALLREIHQPPAILYCKGNLQPTELQIAIVGSRRADVYGLTVAEKLAEELSRAGICVVSGLARGIDAKAHWGALKGVGGTIAVQGCGIDRIYPRENRALAREILAHERGCILSELPLGSEPLGWHFPRRNRIISGLCQGVVLVQATEKSGAFITVETALEEGRDVFAVPGEIYNPRSAGPNRFLQEGARPVTCGDDILSEYGLKIARATPSKKPSSAADCEPPAKIELSHAEAQVLQCITAEPVSIEELTVLSHLSVAELAPVLSMLEVYGLVRQQLGRHYIRVG